MYKPFIKLSYKQNLLYKALSYNNIDYNVPNLFLNQNTYCILSQALIHLHFSFKTRFLFYLYLYCIFCIFGIELIIIDIRLLYTRDPFKLPFFKMHNKCKSCIFLLCKPSLFCHFSNIV